MSKRTRQAAKKNQGWILTRKIVQYVMLAVFVVFFVMSRRDGGWEGSVVNLPMRLDPLLVLANLLSSRSFLAGSALALITIAVTLIFGRAWCGWICPLGTTLDLFSMAKLRGDRRAPPETFRAIKYLFLVAILITSAFGSLSLLALDPLTILYRALTTALWPLFDRLIISLERLLYQVPFLSDPVAEFDALIRPGLLPISPAHFQGAVLFGFLFIGILFLNAISQRFWCRYLCPLGGLLGLLSKAALVRRQVSSECSGCALCARVCPTATIDPGKQFRSDPGECTMCLDCLAPCARASTAFSVRTPQVAWNEYDPGRRQFLLTAGLTATAVTLSRTGLLEKREPSFLLRPPGARETNANALSLTDCVRCSACMRACPTYAIQPGLLEGGIEAFGSPILNMRMGYCDYSCNACGNVCPVQAIPPLTLEEKRLQVIGKAYINTDRCIAWSDHIPCIVCEEMCPLPEKAIQLEEQEVWAPGNLTTRIKLPHVIRDTCIGCGICEYKCPVNGESAIRVYVPSAPVPF